MRSLRAPTRAPFLLLGLFASVAVACGGDEPGSAPPAVATAGAGGQKAGGAAGSVGGSSAGPGGSATGGKGGAGGHSVGSKKPGEACVVDADCG